MLEFLSSPWARVVMLFAGIAALVTLGAYVTSKWRGTNEQDTMTANELLSNFREMHSQGVVSEEEFRTIKAKLAGDIQKELKDTDEPG